MSPQDVFLQLHLWPFAVKAVIQFSRLNPSVLGFSLKPAELCACPCNSGAAGTDVRPETLCLPPPTHLTYHVMSCMLSKITITCMDQTFDQTCQPARCALCFLMFIYVLVQYMYINFSLCNSVCLCSESVCVYVCINIQLSVCQACGTEPPR